MKQWSIGKKLLAGFGSVVATAIAVGVIALWAASALNRHVDQLAAVSGRALQTGAEVRYLVADLKARERLVVIAAAKQDTAVITTETVLVQSDYEKLRAATHTLTEVSALPRVREDANGINQAMTAWLDQWGKTEKFAATFAALDAADSTDVGRKFSDKADALSGDIEAAESGQFADDRASASGIYTTMQLAIGVSLLLALLLAGAAGYVIRGTTETLRRSAAQLRSGSDRVLAAAAQVAGSAQTLSRGVQQEAASLEETSASMEEISSMTRQNAEHSQAAAQLMAHAEQSVTTANQVLTELVTSMGNIKESSRKVSNIIKTIDEIAFQTNILALNAAVEAARAGEAGMGFAVVADEVRNLAQRSAHAAKDTAGLIEEAIARSDRGALRVEKVDASIRDITDSVAKVKSLIDHVSEASRQQAHGFQQVAHALQQMEQMTQTNASTAEASAGAGATLNTEARESLATVERLEALVGQSGGTSAEENRGPAAEALEQADRAAA